MAASIINYSTPDPRPTILPIQAGRTRLAERCQPVSTRFLAALETTPGDIILPSKPNNTALRFSVFLYVLTGTCNCGECRNLCVR